MRVFPLLLPLVVTVSRPAGAAPLGQPPLRRHELTRLHDAQQAS